MHPQKEPNRVFLITEPLLPALTSRVKDFITTRLARREPPERIANTLRALFEIEIDPALVVPYWRGEIPTQTECRPDKESVQCPADQASEPLISPLPEDETTQVLPDALPEEGLSESPSLEPTQTLDAITLDSHEISEDVDQAEEPSTQTGHRQNEDSLCIPVGLLDEPTAQEEAISALGDLAKARLGLEPDPPARKAPNFLSDEVKAFIVRGLARYETPIRIVVSVKAQFGIVVDRRQVYAYDPAGSRPPARRWIDLFIATRAQFLAATAEIGIAQKVVRLRMLDRFANRADQNNQLERGAALLAQAAKECGGFYERYQRPKAA